MLVPVTCHACLAFSTPHSASLPGDLGCAGGDPGVMAVCPLPTRCRCPLQDHGEPQPSQSDRVGLSPGRGGGAAHANSCAVSPGTPGHGCGGSGGGSGWLELDLTIVLLPCQDQALTCARRHLIQASLSPYKGGTLHIPGVFGTQRCPVTVLRSHSQAVVELVWSPLTGQCQRSGK